MKNYMRNGNAIEVTLEDGRLVKVAAKYIERMVEKLEIDEEEAILTWLEDEEYLTNDEQEELTNQAKENKSVKIIDAKTERPEKKTQKERTRKENPTKEMVIAKIAEILPEFAQNIVVENKGKLITFTIGEDEFKIDLVQKDKLLNLISLYSKEYDFKAVVPISASKDDGTEVIVNELVKLLPVGPKYYADDEYTDQTMRQIAEEIIREKALKLLDDEVPHGIYVEVESFKDRVTTKGQDIYDIDATIYCLRESHKGIIIGKGGNLLKRIASYARQDLEKMLDTKVNLKVWVKVKEDWLEKDNIVNKFKLK